MPTRVASTIPLSWVLPTWMATPEMPITKTTAERRRFRERE